MFKGSFFNFGHGSRIFSPLIIEGHNRIDIRNNVVVMNYSWLLVISDVGDSAPIKPKIIIKDNAYIGNFSHIVSKKLITIERSALIADRVYISDNNHAYLDPNSPILSQEITALKNVIIGEGCWIGNNVCVIGASIGKNSVVGANSVVTRDIPDYCVAVGNPAKVIKKYNFQKKMWVSV